MLFFKKYFTFSTNRDFFSLSKKSFRYYSSYKKHFGVFYRNYNKYFSEKNMNGNKQNYFLNLAKSEISKNAENSENQILISFSDEITEDQKEKITTSKKFLDYVKTLDKEKLIIREMKILNTYMFGKNVGFINLELDCSLKTHPEKKLPGFVFIRGKSVGIIVLVNRKYILLTNQFRVPTGKMMSEIPAGMLDESGDFVGVAAKELEEEIGVRIKKEDLVYLTSIIPSGGGCDEEILIYLKELDLSEGEIAKMISKTYGEEGSDEVISLKIEEFTCENVLKTKDAKLISAAFALVEGKGIGFYKK